MTDRPRDAWLDDVDELVAETERQSRGEFDKYEATLIRYGNMIWDPSSRQFITEITDRDTHTNPEENTE